jgi:hypothetical protein
MLWIFADFSGLIFFLGLRTTGFAMVLLLCQVLLTRPGRPREQKR